MTIICVSGFTLTSERGTPRHLMRAMARQIPVLYINPPHSRGRWEREKQKLSQAISDRNFRTITPVLLTTFRFLPRRVRRWIVALMATPMVLRQLEGWLKPPYFWSYLGELTIPLTRALKADLLCYHRLDDYSIMSPKER